MPDPTRPTAGAPIATDWGQDVHDATFTPQGARVAGGGTVAVGTTLAQCQLNTAVDDPGGWLASDALTVPSDAAGLYVYSLAVSSSGGDAAGNTRVVVRRNGSEIARAQHEQEGASPVVLNLSDVVDLAAGDVLTVWARNSDGTPAATIEVQRMAVVRLGSVLGA